MKRFYNLVILLLLVPAISWASEGKYRHTKSKTLSKKYDMSKTGQVEIDNSFGSVSITTWDRAEVTMEVKVTVSGDNLDKVENRLREIDVDFYLSDDKIGAKTINIDNGSNGGSFWSLFSNKNNRNHKIEVDYIVRMPVTASLDLSNDYGAIILDRIEGPTKISCDFGRLDLGQLMHTDNELRFDYTKNSSIDYMKSGVIRADFSAFDLYGCERLDYKGDYTQADIKEVKELTYNCDFGGIKVGKTNVVNGRGDYLTSRVNLVMQRADFVTDFGSITIDELSSQIQQVSIRSDYTKIRLGYNSASQFNFDIDTEFASIDLSSDVMVNLSEKDHSDRRKAGFVGTPDTGHLLKIKSSFGGVQLSKNN